MQSRLRLRLCLCAPVCVCVGVGVSREHGTMREGRGDQNNNYPTKPPPHTHTHSRFFFLRPTFTQNTCMTPHVPLLFFFSARKPRGRYHHSTNKTSGLLANASTHSHAFSLQTHMSTATIRDAQRERKKKQEKTRKKLCSLSFALFC